MARPFVGAIAGAVDTSLAATTWTALGTTGFLTGQTTWNVNVKVKWEHDRFFVFSKQAVFAGQRNCHYNLDPARGQSWVPFLMYNELNVPLDIARNSDGYWYAVCRANSTSTSILYNNIMYKTPTGAWDSWSFANYTFFPVGFYKAANGTLMCYGTKTATSTYPVLYKKDATGTGWTAVFEASANTTHGAITGGIAGSQIEMLGTSKGYVLVKAPADTTYTAYGPYGSTALTDFTWTTTAVNDERFGFAGNGTMYQVRGPQWGSYAYNPMKVGSEYDGSAGGGELGYGLVGGNGFINNDYKYAGNNIIIPASKYADGTNNHRWIQTNVKSNTTGGATFRVVKTDGNFQGEISPGYNMGWDYNHGKTYVPGTTMMSNNTAIQLAYSPDLDYVLAAATGKSTTSTPPWNTSNVVKGFAWTNVYNDTNL